jgi:hypothetical protein
MLSPLGGEKKIRQVAPVTLAKLTFTDTGIEQEAREAAAIAAEKRTTRAGRDAWESVTKAESFGAWKTIGAALAVGKAHALKVSDAKQAWGSAYSRAFCDWIRAHGFERMPKSVRSVAIELHENISAIEAWRLTLDEKDRRRLSHPLSNVRRWRAATTPRPEADAVAKAEAAWRNFLRCVSGLSPQQAWPIWREAHAEALRSIRWISSSQHG